MYYVNRFVSLVLSARTAPLILVGKLDVAVRRILLLYDIGIRHNLELHGDQLINGCIIQHGLYLRSMRLHG